MSDAGSSGPVGSGNRSQGVSRPELNRRNLVAGIAGMSGMSVGLLPKRGVTTAVPPTGQPALSSSSSVVNVKDQGAIGDGVTDDTAAIRASLDAVSSGGTVFIPTGTFLIDPATSPLMVASNVTIMGEGPRSILKVKNDVGDYASIFGAATSNTHVEYVRFLDFTIDQNPTGNTTADIQSIEGQQQYVIALYAFRDVAVERVHFDPYCGVNSVNLNGAETQTARITQCFFRFQRGASATPAYDNSAIYLECENHAVDGCVFETNISEKALGAIETHNGPSIICNNLSDGFQTGVNIVSEFHDVDTRETNDISVTGNTFSRTVSGISLWSGTDRILRNITVANNAISVAQVSHDIRDSSGVRMVYLVGEDQQGGFEDIAIVGNNIVFEDEPPEGRSRSQAGEELAVGSTYGIGLAPYGDVTNVLVAANVVSRAPVRGLLLGNDETGNTSRNIRIVDNIFTDAGQNSGVADSYRAGIALVSTLHDVVVEHNSIIDTGDTRFGNHAFYVQPTSATRVLVRHNHIGAKEGTLTSTLDYTQVQVFEQTLASGIAAPTSGTWKRGDIVYHLEPVSGGQVGWVCVNGGDPGEWRTFGAID